MRTAILATASASRKNLENNHNLNFNDSTSQTPTRRPQPRPPPNRPPLQSRDSNAMMRVPLKAPLATKPPNASPKMPFDKQQRPIMPTLASAKTANRTPLTPRVAGSNPPTANTTPVPRRNGRSDNNTPNAASREDSYLSNNITPRSGSRKTRVESPGHGIAINYTSPNEIRVAPTSAYSGGLNINGLDNKDIQKRPTVSFSPSVSEVGSRVQTPSTTSESKFFFASDAKTVTQPTRPPLPSKTSSSTFLYANGETITPVTTTSNTPAGSVVGEERAQPKFFHANGTPDLPPANSPSNYPPRPSSVLSTSSRASPRPGALSPLQRPASPAKLNNLNQYASISSLRSVPPLPLPVLPRPQGGRGQTTSSVVGNRRTSFESPKLASHGRSSSVGSGDAKGLMTRKVSGGSQIDLPSPGSPLNHITNNLPVSTPEEIPQDENAGDLDSGLRSPLKTGKTLEELNELAANARRERKVLDLEITNSSLEAINRTLEREMRKQTAELRRYRRLSRSGRLSINTIGSTRQSIDSVMETDVEASTMLSDMSEEEDEDEEADDESDFTEDDFSDDTSLSPSAMAESDARHRKRDEKRLQLDLSKHQQLLVDSQKMNQSLKRCLGWTEVLISEGRKALEYNVKISDVELGGRVLALDEIEERRREEENEGMSDIGAQLLREARERQAKVKKEIDEELNAACGAWGGEGRDDRDSGIELDSAQREQFAGVE